jgi:hypothetical protein
MNERLQHPRLMGTAVGRELDTWRGVLYAITADGGRIRLAECKHSHRSKTKALVCADALAILDGAPRP